MMKWIKRIVLGLVGLIGLFILTLAGFIIFDTLFGQSSTELTNVAYTDSEGTELYGYLAKPEGEGPFPAVLMIHEWWGLNEGIIVLADALAEEGYIVLAADAYRGRLTSQIPRALWMRLTTPEEQVFGDLDVALEYLQSLPEADAERTATMGFCFGGEHSLQLGLRQSERLAMTIMYYGAVETNPELLRPLIDNQPVLGIFAEEDQQIFVDEVLEFEAALNSLNITNQITIYPDVGHAFINEENFNQPGTAGDAWQEAIEFLEDNLQ
ncbi:MAG: dienelactone hydrolase family protein [Chloroflexota bacterium]